MSNSNESSKAELHIQIHSPVKRNESTNDRLFGRQSSFSSNRLGLTSNDDSLAAGKSIWWIWGGSKYSGVLCMVISSVFYSFMGLFVKLLSGVNILHKHAAHTPALSCCGNNYILSLHIVK